MWEMGNLWTDGVSNQMGSYHALMHEIHVLVVDHESECLVHTARLLEMCQYRVTLVELASAAIQMLTTGKVKFDMVMANINSPDLHGFKLLQHAVDMDLPIILMSADDNTFMAMKALENGAFLYMKKPATMEMARCLWQHVHREKTRMMRERERLVAVNYNSRAIEYGEQIHQHERNPNNIGNNEMLMMKDKGKSKKKIRERNDNISGNHEDYDDIGNDMNDNNKLKRKVCTEWTQELHAKFMNAIEVLGEGRCFPREILELMNVPELTRMQVASHLQKCRNENWRTPEERKIMNQTLGGGSSNTSGSQSKPRRFGSMPKIGKALYQNNGVELSSQTRSETESGGHGNMGNQHVMMENSIAHHQISGSMIQLGPSSSSSNRKNQSDELFNFPGMDCLIQDLSAMPQGFAMNNNAGENPGQYNYDPTIYPEQNSAIPSMDTTSPWSSEKSNFGSEDSETKGHE